MGSRISFIERIRSYEEFTSNTFMRGLPIFARLDGKGFSKFTKGLKRPFDERLSYLMIETAKHLVGEFDMTIGFTGSDEITLCWIPQNPYTDIFFGGRVFKWICDLSSSASVFFNKNLKDFIPEKGDKSPRLDCRVWQTPNLEESANTFKFREGDITKNSISMATENFYSYKELLGKNSKQKQEMLFEKGVNWNDYPAYFKRGSYVAKRIFSKEFTDLEIEKLPAKHNARIDKNFKIERAEVVELFLPKIETIFNLSDVLFKESEIIIKE